jgi:hypothetical protein
VRIVWQVTLDDIATVHLHPRDIGGAIVSIDQPRPAESWRWGGPEWREKARTDVVRGIASVTLASPDPAALAARWGEILGLGGGVGNELRLDPGAIRFVAGDGRGDGIEAVGLVAVDRRRALENARRRGLRASEHAVWIGGVRFDVE